MKNKVASLLVTALFITAWSCQNRQQSTENQTVEDTIGYKHENCEHVHWTYEGEEGPQYWAQICPGYSSCSGQSQSPVDISNPTENPELQPLDVEFTTTPVDIVNNGHTVQFNVDSGSYTVAGDEKYFLKQFHFHSSSEHTINSEYYPLEVHFVHANQTGDKYLVIGIMFEEGEENSLFGNYLDQFPKEKGEYTSENTLKLSDILPENKSYYHYSGSLTTPPCSEIVSWYVLKEPLEASRDQIEKFSEILEDNFRPVQPLNGREIYEYNVQ